MRYALRALIFGIQCAFASAATAQGYSIIYNLPRKSEPSSRLYEDSTGALYGTSYTGGTHNAGYVYLLTQTQGQWTGSTIYNFGSYSGDGGSPDSGLVADSNGVLYGATEVGGTNRYGTVYALSQSSGTWNDQVLYSFSGGSDGLFPSGDLLYSATSGALYGTTEGGTTCGTAFELVQSGGSWSFATIHTFQGGDGCNPLRAALHPGSEAGTLFGVTYNGGAYGKGTVFELQENSGTWTETVLYSFAGGHGQHPVDIDGGKQIGNLLYGVTSSGGHAGRGVVFELIKQSEGWQESVIYKLQNKPDGNEPAGLKRDTATGSLYGTTLRGGYYGRGILFQLTPNGDSWSESILHDFGTPREHDGRAAWARPIQDKTTGALFGITGGGGSRRGGTVWTATPQSEPQGGHNEISAVQTGS